MVSLKGSRKYLNHSVVKILDSPILSQLRSFTIVYQERKRSFSIVSLKGSRKYLNNSGVKIPDSPILSLILRVIVLAYPV